MVILLLYSKIKFVEVSDLSLSYSSMLNSLNIEFFSDDSLSSANCS